MQDQGIAGPAAASVRARSVSGLGVCDVWRLELSAAQWPWLVVELEELRGPLEEALQHAWAKQAVDDSESLADEVAAREYDLRLVRAMRAQLPARGHDGTVVFAGPDELVRELVDGTVRNVVGALSELVDAQRVGDEHDRARLIETAEAAAAWVQTLVDCQEVEAFSFDPAADPVPMR
jgi:hypothetical protein